MSFSSFRLLSSMALLTILLLLVNHCPQSTNALNTLSSSLSSSNAEVLLSSNVTTNRSGLMSARLGYDEQGGSCVSLLDNQDLSSGCDESAQRLYPGTSDKLKCHALFYSLTCRMKAACEWCTEDYQDYVYLAVSILNEKRKQCGNWSRDYPKLECRSTTPQTDVPMTAAPEPEHHHHINYGLVMAIVIPLVGVSIILVVLGIYMYRYYYSSKKAAWANGAGGFLLPANLKQSSVGAKQQSGGTAVGTIEPSRTSVGAKLQNAATTVETKEQSRVSVGAQQQSGATVGTMEPNHASVGPKQPNLV